MATEKIFSIETISPNQDGIILLNNGRIFHVTVIDDSATKKSLIIHGIVDADDQITTVIKELPIGKKRKYLDSLLSSLVTNLIQTDSNFDISDFESIELSPDLYLSKNNKDDDSDRLQRINEEVRKHGNFLPMGDVSSLYPEFFDNKQKNSD